MRSQVNGGPLGARPTRLKGARIRKSPRSWELQRTKQRVGASGNRLRRGVFRDVMELVSAFDDYVDHHNEMPKPFIWTASANDILEKVKRARKTLVNVQSV
jgi:hypothetical protein